MVRNGAARLIPALVSAPVVATKYCTAARACCTCSIKALTVTTITLNSRTQYDQYDLWLVNSIQTPHLSASAQDVSSQFNLISIVVNRRAVHQ
jgi:hypothetical protein